MNISEHLKKKYWRRRVYGDLPTELPTKSEYYYNDYLNEDNVTYRLMTQEDLLREIEPSAHDINSKYMSTRPIKEARTKLDENGNQATMIWKLSVAVCNVDSHSSRQAISQLMAFGFLTSRKTTTSEIIVYSTR